MKNTTKTGNDAERAVADELTRRGYRIVELNWKTPYAEIDIVASRSGTMYFVEVKFRSSLLAGDGFDYITAKKLQHMMRAAEAWVVSHDWQGPYELLAAAVMKAGDTYDIDIREIV